MRSPYEALNLGVGLRIASRFVLEAPLRDAPLWSIWKAKDTALDALVSLSVVKAEVGAESARGIFVREMNRLRALSNRALPELLSVGFEGSVPVLAYSPAEAVTLREPMSRGQRLRAADVGRLLVELSVAIDAMHGMKPWMVHRAISPESVLMAVRPARALLEGAGIAYALGEARAMPTATAGLRYLSPDELLGRVERRTDIFEMASLAFECLTSRAAFAGDSTAQLEGALLRGPRPSAKALRDELPVEVDEILARAWAVDPLAVYSSASAFARDLSSMLSIVTPGAIAPRKVHATLVGAVAPPGFPSGEAHKPASQPLPPKKPPPFTSFRATSRSVPPPVPEVQTALPPIAPSRLVPPLPPASATLGHRPPPVADTTQPLPLPSSAVTVIGHPPGMASPPEASPPEASPPEASPLPMRPTRSEAGLEEDVDRAFDAMFAGEAPNDSDTVRMPRSAADASEARTQPRGLVPAVSPEAQVRAEDSITDAAARELSMIPDSSGEAGSELRYRQPTQKVSVPQMRPPGTARLSAPRPPFDSEATDVIPVRATLAQASELSPDAIDPGPRITQDLWESLDSSLGDIDLAPAPSTPETAVVQVPTPEASTLAPEAPEAPSALAFSPAHASPVATLVEAPAREIQLSPAEGAPQAAPVGPFGEVPEVPAEVVSIPPVVLGSEGPPSLLSSVNPFDAAPASPFDPVAASPPPTPPPTPPAAREIPLVPAPVSSVALVETPVSVAAPLPKQVAVPRPDLDLTVKLPGVIPPSAPSVAVQVARILGPSVVLAALIVTGGQIYLAHIHSAAHDPVDSLVPLRVVVAPDPTVVPSDVTAPRAADSPDATEPSVALTADASSSPDGTLVQTPLDVPRLAALAPESDAGAASERLPRHPRGQGVVALDERMYAAIVGCVRAVPHTHRVRVSATFAGSTGLATVVRVGANYADPPTGPCIEQAARTVSAGRFSDPSWETAFSFVVAD